MPNSFASIADRGSAVRSPSVASDAAGNTSISDGSINSRVAAERGRLTFRKPAGRSVRHS
jgi:hypothetical protein